MRSVIALSAAIIAGGLAYFYWSDSQQKVPVAPDIIGANPALTDVLLPEGLSRNAQIGKGAFEAKCAACHGTNAAGQAGVAPPLVHKIYEPSHHADESFQRAAKLGVRAHHWRFGDMPPVEGVTRGDVTMIIAYVRELQRANGIN